MIGRVLGVPVHVLGLSEARDEIANWVRSGKRPPAIIAHTNALSLVTAQEEPGYHQALQSFDLSLADGMPVVWLLRLRGYAQHERVYGPDLMHMLCGQAATEGWKCFLYGGGSGVPELVRDKLKALYPSLQVVGIYSPPFRDLTKAEDDEVVRMINTAGPDILWVALGGAKQDLWMVRHRERLNASVIHGVGAAFDFLAGRVPQAPRWMMKAGLEWFFRLLAEPRRLWRRYTLKNAKFLYFVLTRELVNGWFREGKRRKATEKGNR